MKYKMKLLIILALTIYKTMKNTLSILCFLCVIFVGVSNSVSAQDNIDKKFKFGLGGQAILGWAKPENKNMTNEGAALGYSYGLMGDYKFGKNYSFAFGLDVQTLNNNVGFSSDTISIISKSSVTSNDTSIMYPATSLYKNHFGFVNLPITLKMNTNEIGYMTYFAKFGLELGVGYKSVSDVESTITKPAGAPVVDNKDFDISGQTSLFRTALVIGGGFEYSIAGKTGIMVGITYSNGFTNMYTKYDRTPDPKVENRTINFDSNGDLKHDSANKLVVDGEFKKAYSKYVALHVGIFF